MNFIRWLAATVALGVAFLAGQLVVWRELAARGVYLATNPSSSFFYVLTAAHGVHLLGGVLALGYVVLHAGRMARGRERRTALDVTAIYWHFMDALWIYIFLFADEMGVGIEAIGRSGDPVIGRTKSNLPRIGSVHPITRSRELTDRMSKNPRRRFLPFAHPIARSSDHPMLANGYRLG